MTAQELLTERIRGEQNLLRAIDRMYKGRAKSVKEIKVTARELLIERIRGEQNR